MISRPLNLFGEPMLTSPNQGAVPETDRPGALTGAGSQGAEVGGLGEMLCPASAAHGQNSRVPSGKKRCLLLGVLYSRIVVACVAFSSLPFI